MCNITKEAPSTGYSTDAVQLVQGDAAVSVAGADPSRRAVTVINDPDGTVDIYVCGSLGQRYTTGIKLKPGAGLPINTIAPVFVSSPSGAAIIYVICETGANL